MASSRSSETGFNPWYAFFIGIVCGVFSAQVGLWAKNYVPADCIDTCHPHVAEWLKQECFCAVDDGWIRSDVSNTIRHANMTENK